MNTPDQDLPLNPPAPATQTAASEVPQEHPQAAGPYGSFLGAVHAGSHDARSRALATAPKVKQAAANAAYQAAYSVAFGALFASTLARELLPRTLKNGLAKGAAAGRCAAHQWQPAAPDAVANAI